MKVIQRLQASGEKSMIGSLKKTVRTAGKHHYSVLSVWCLVTGWLFYVYSQIASNNTLMSGNLQALEASLTVSLGPCYVRCPTVSADSGHTTRARKS